MHLVGWINREQVPPGPVGQIWLWKTRKSSFLENSSSRATAVRFSEPEVIPAQEKLPGKTQSHRTTVKSTLGMGIFKSTLGIFKSTLGMGILPKCLQTSIPVGFHPDWAPQTGPFVILVSQGWWRQPQLRRGRWAQPQTPRKWIFYFWSGFFHPLVLGSCHLLPHGSTSWDVKVKLREKCSTHWASSVCTELLCFFYLVIILIF